jgi:hypothetical protein
MSNEKLLESSFCSVALTFCMKSRVCVLVLCTWLVPTQVRDGNFVVERDFGTVLETGLANAPTQSSRYIDFDVGRFRRPQFISSAGKKSTSLFEHGNFYALHRCCCRCMLCFPRVMCIFIRLSD